jgi:putative DNA primase/helicase
MQITVGKSRKDIRWKVLDLTWEDLCKRLSATYRTTETLNEYKAMKKNEKDLKKDVGGYVGGVIEGGRRMGKNVKSRSLITLDADYAKKGMWDEVTLLHEYTMCCYSTHSHAPNAPRLRFVIPLDREVSVEEYEPIARLLAKDMGIEQFDVTTYEASRLMYWPSTSKDAEFIFERQDGELLSADKTLARYKDWTNSLEWPLADREQSVQHRNAKVQGDPESKAGMVGLFCRAYNAESAIDEFLSDVYIPCDEPNRYTYAPGSTSGGVVLYGNGQFSFSHHATDPAGGKLCNAFDLVRLHKFGALDDELDPDTQINRRPSFTKMTEFASGIKAIQVTNMSERMAEVDEDFKVEDWAELPKTDKSGKMMITQPNIQIILRNDPNLKGRMRWNEMMQRLVILDDLPWRECRDRVNGTPWSDSDDACLRGYIENTYGIRQTQITEDAIKAVSLETGFHPIKDYLLGLEWDGIPRAETFFIDWMHAKDDIYVRTVTRKWLAAAVTRVMRPGCKFDHMIVLVSDQGAGKSMLAKKLGKEWFSDTFDTVRGKEGLEQLRGFWIVEMAELSAMRKNDAESVKHFISKQEDSYRQAYGKHMSSFPRQCVFYGTTNENDFLKDRTGNRRFWPIAIKKAETVFDVTSAVIDQVWAEAVVLYKNGEKLYLDRVMEEAALQRQDAYLEDNPKLGMIEAYLDKLLPMNWDEMSANDRRDFIGGYLGSEHKIELVRTRVCVQEIMSELFSLSASNVPLYAVKEYHNLMSAIHGWKRAESRKMTIYGKQTVYERVFN